MQPRTLHTICNRSNSYIFIFLLFVSLFSKIKSNIFILIKTLLWLVEIACDDSFDYVFSIMVETKTQGINDSAKTFLTQLWT